MVYIVYIVIAPRNSSQGPWPHSARYGRDRTKSQSLSQGTCSLRMEMFVFVAGVLPCGTAKPWGTWHRSESGERLLPEGRAHFSSSGAVSGREGNAESNHHTAPTV